MLKAEKHIFYIHMYCTQESTQNIKYMKAQWGRVKNEEEKVKQTYRKLNFGYSKCERKEATFWADMLFPFLHLCYCGFQYFRRMY